MTDQNPFAKEWLETNETGAFASGSVAGACTRQYHNLLMVPRHPPVDRVILVHKCEAFVSLQDERYPLSANLYPETIHPDGHRYLASFEHDPWPLWTYRIPDAGVTLDRELFLVRGHSLVAVGWHLRDAPEPVHLSLRPMMSGRDYRVLQESNSHVRMNTRERDHHLSWNPYDEIPVVHAYHSGTFTADPDWYHNIQYRATYNHEPTRTEDWWTPGRIKDRLSPGETAHVLFTIDPSLENPSFDRLKRNERKHRRSKIPSAKEKNTPTFDRQLARAAMDFPVRRDKGETLFAGYPWFTDWGRDTFISLPGFMLSTDKYDMARDILSTFSDYISRGMIPNRFPESGKQPEYNTMDASLWFLHALGKYVSYTGDESFARNEGWTALLEILTGYRSGTRYGIQMDEDGLIRGGTPDTQLTWMDAKVGDRTFTPRDGKPVEIQALWIRSLQVASMLAELREDRERKTSFNQLRSRAIESFRNRFWYEDGKYLFDVVDGHRGNDRRVRPNQIYAAMFHGILPADRRRAVVDRVQSDLLTPVGLRTLAPDEEEFHGEYAGPRFERDRAYHQGTVWPYLLGGFVSAWLRVREGTDEQRREARSFFDGLERHLKNDACLGQVSEIFDGSPPHRPKGCIAQAWSVAEPLRALHEDVYETDPGER